jgi:hypothetical protein
VLFVLLIFQVVVYWISVLYSPGTSEVAAYQRF